MASRKTQKETKVFWFQGLTEGMDQATDPGLTNGSELLKNASLDQLGNYSRRKGSYLTATKIGANQGYGLWDYNLTDGTHKLFAVTDRDLYVFTEATPSWGSAIDTDEWVASKRVDAVDFLNRSYIGCESGTDPLCYTTGSTVTDVTPTIGGGILAVNKDILAVAGNSARPDVIFYSDPFTDTFHSATGTCAANADVGGAGTVTTTTEIFEADVEGAILYNTTEGVMNLITDWTDGDTVTTDNYDATSSWDNDTVYVMQNNFRLNGVCTGMAGLGEHFVSFTEDKMYLWDPTTNWSDDKKGIGCANYRTVQVLNGWLVWANRNGIWRYSPQYGVEEITSKIKNKVNGYGLFDLISTANWASAICSGVREVQGEYWLSVGTLSTVSGAPASATANVIIVINIKTGNWTYHTYQDQIVAMTNFINSSGSKDLYGIGAGDSAVWRFDYGIIDDNAAGTDQAIAFEARTPHHQLFKNATKTSVVKSYYVKYTSSGDVVVYDGVDRSYSTTALATLSSTTTPKTIELKPLANREGYTHSLKFTSSSAVTIEGYGFEAQLGTTTRLANQ